MPRGNPKQFDEKNRLQRLNTINLIKEAVDLLNETGEILDINTVSDKTKEIDPINKGISKAAFYNKKLTHIQNIMMELRIGPFKSLKVSESPEDVDLANEIIKLNKEKEKLNKIISEKETRIKKLKEKIEKIYIENDELRIKIYEIELINKIKTPFNQANNA